MAQLEEAVMDVEGRWTEVLVLGPSILLGWLPAGRFF